MNWLKRLLFWRRFKADAPPSAPVLLHWSRASAAAKVRVALWQESRDFEGEQLGPGFVDYWSGRPLAQDGQAGRLYWRRLPLR